jgi:hypothetical protein
VTVNDHDFQAVTVMVTDDDIARLRDEAREVRNWLLGDRCRQALAGDRNARAVVAGVFAASAEARGDFREHHYQAAGTEWYICPAGHHVIDGERWAHDTLLCEQPDGGD